MLLTHVALRPCYGPVSLVLLCILTSPFSTVVSATVYPSTSAAAGYRVDDEEDDDDDEEDKVEKDDAEKSDDEEGADDKQASKQGDASKKDKSEEAAEVKKEGDAKDTPSEKKNKKKKDPAKIEWKGTFATKEMTPVAVHVDEWSQLEVVSCAEHGKKVRKGDVLLQLRTDKIDLAIQSLQHDVELGKLSLEGAEEALSLLRKSTPLALATAERNERRASEQLKRYLTIDREASKDSLEFSLKSTKNYLDYQEEELHQLEQMYKEDDLTEETEEIILKRTRDQVDSARFSVARAERDHDKGLSIDLPRRQEDLETALQQANVELERSRDSLPAKMVESEIQLKKLQLTQKKLVDQLERMEKDREQLVVKASTGGVVFLGESSALGKWSDAVTLAKSLNPGSAVKSDQVILTIVQPRPIYILTEIPEKDWLHAKAGTEVEVVATAFPDLKWKGKIDAISVIPVGDGKFSATASCELPGEADAIVPGMSCTLKYEVPAKEEAKEEAKGKDAK